MTPKLDQTVATVEVVALLIAAIVVTAFAPGHWWLLGAGLFGAALFLAAIDAYVRSDSQRFQVLDAADWDDLEAWWQDWQQS